MPIYEKEKNEFLSHLKFFAGTLSNFILQDNAWTVRGFIDRFENIYPVPLDGKVIANVLEIHLLPHFLNFANEMNFRVELAKFQNYYPDMTFISNQNPAVKFAVDLKISLRDEEDENFCVGFSLGSRGAYFIERDSKKNIQYPYNEYSGHFCVGIIYSRNVTNEENIFQCYQLNELKEIPAVLKDFIFFAEEKWKIAADNHGNGNALSIGSIKCIEDLLAGRGVFSLAGEEIFDDFWLNYGKLEIPKGKRGHKKLSNFKEFLKFKGLPESLYCPKRTKKAIR